MALVCSCLEVKKTLQKSSFVLLISLFLLGCPEESKTPAGSPTPPSPSGGNDSKSPEDESAVGPGGSHGTSSGNDSSNGAPGASTHLLFTDPQHRLHSCVYRGPAPFENEINPLSPLQKEQIIEYLSCVLPVGSYIGLTDSGRECSFKIGSREERPQDFMISLEVKRDPPRIGGVIRNHLNSLSTVGLTFLEESHERISLQLRRDDRWMGSTNFDILVEIDPLGYLESVYLFDQSGLNQQLSRARCNLTDYDGEGIYPVAGGQNGGAP